MTKEFKPKGPYVSLEFISRGSLGEVYRARTSEGACLAIKRLRPHLIFDRKELEHFHHELEVLKKLHHAAFPRFKQWVEADGEIYLEMEWLEGKDMHEVFVREQDLKIRERKVMQWGLSILEALKYLQKLAPPQGGINGLIHCDLNPKNVLVGETGSAKIFDFSHSVWLAKGDESKGGTWGYMGLKQMEHHKVSFQTDLFAAGLLLIEALSGERVLKGKNTFEIFLSTEDLDPREEIKKVSSHPVIRKVAEDLILSVRDGNNPIEECISLFKKETGA